MARTDFELQVAGIKELVQGLRTMQDPKVLGRVIGASLDRTGRAVVVPAIKRRIAADTKNPGSHRPPRSKDGSGAATPKRGTQGPAARNVTSRAVKRLRPGELVARNFGPRAWYSHFPIVGTRPHEIRPRPGNTRGLYVRGRWVSRVDHPGSRGTDSVRKAVQGVVPVLDARYAKDLDAAWQRHLTGPTRRARPKPPG